MTDKEYIERLKEEITSLKKMNVFAELNDETVRSNEILTDEVEDLRRENGELKEALKHVNPCCEWNDDVHACEFMVRAPEYARELKKAKAIIEELSDTYFMDINEKTEERQNIRNRAIAFLNGGEQ